MMAFQDEPRLREVLKFANACGAITTTKKGAIPALPNESDALALIKGNVYGKMFQTLFKKLLDLTKKASRKQRGRAEMLEGKSKEKIREGVE